MSMLICMGIWLKPENPSGEGSLQTDLSFYEGCKIIAVFCSYTAII